MEYIEQNSHFWERTTIFEKNCGNKIERESRKNWKKTRVIQGGKNKEEKRRKIDANPRLAYISSKLKSKHARLLHRKVVGEETTVPSSNGHCLISYISLFLFFSFYKLIPSMWKIRRRENRRLVGRTRIDVSIEKAWKDMWRSRCERFYTWLLRVRICHRCCAAEVTITGMRRVDRFYFRSEMRHVSWTAALWKIKVDLVDRFGYRSRKGARVCRPISWYPAHDRPITRIVARVSDKNFRLVAWERAEYRERNLIPRAVEKVRISLAIFVKFSIDQIRQAIRDEKFLSKLIIERKWLKNIYISNPICVWNLVLLHSRRQVEKRS